MCSKLSKCSVRVYDFDSIHSQVCTVLSVCVRLRVWRLGGVFVRAFTLAFACAILFNYRSGFEAEANSAIITGNTSFNILWKSTLCVGVFLCLCACVRSVCECVRA